MKNKIQITGLERGVLLTVHGGQEKKTILSNMSNTSYVTRRFTYKICIRCLLSKNRDSDRYACVPSLFPAPPNHSSEYMKVKGNSDSDEDTGLLKHKWPSIISDSSVQ